MAHQANSDGMLVAVRVRPPKDLSDPTEWTVQNNVISSTRPELQHLFVFDHIFSQDKTNGDVYDQLVAPIVSSVMDGYHGTVFAYGQTSSGKTHTMMGNDSDPGVIRRAISYIFDRIEKESEEREFFIRVSYLEIYNEQIRDLLRPAPQAVSLFARETTNLQIKGSDVSGLTEQVCRNASELLGYMREGDKNRQVGCTSMNERSSRSHCIFRLTVEAAERRAAQTVVMDDVSDTSVTRSVLLPVRTGEEHTVTVSQLNLVDLAGSERAAQTAMTADQLREGCHINTSLTALGIVIRKLSTGAKHINFRDSKLTRLLQNSLGGNSRTAIVCTISQSDFETSLSTLRFGSAAKLIHNKPVINQVLTENESLLQTRDKEIESLKAFIKKAEAKKELLLREKDQTIWCLQRKLDNLQELAEQGAVVRGNNKDVKLYATKKTEILQNVTPRPGQAFDLPTLENAETGNAFIATSVDSTLTPRPCEGFSLASSGGCRRTHCSGKDNLAFSGEDSLPRKRSYSDNTWKFSKIRCSEDVFAATKSKRTLRVASPVNEGDRSRQVRRETDFFWFCENAGDWKYICEELMGCLRAFSRRVQHFCAIEKSRRSTIIDAKSCVTGATRNNECSSAGQTVFEDNEKADDVFAALGNLRQSARTRSMSEGEKISHFKNYLIGDASLLFAATDGSWAQRGQAEWVPITAS